MRHRSHDPLVTADNIRALFGAETGCLTGEVHEPSEAVAPAPPMRLKQWSARR